MNILDRIKNSLYQRVLRQRGSPRPKRTIVNLFDAKSVGILYDASYPGLDIVIERFAGKLRSKGKTAEILAYINDKKIEHKEGLTLINPKSVNWYGIPVSEQAMAFCNKPFDLLICGVLNDCKPLEYLASISKAKYRVGPFDEQKTHCYDLMIEMGAKRDLDYLLQQMVHFLEKINSNN